MQVEEQEKELSAAEAAGVHHSTVLNAQERALQERKLEIDAARAEMASNVSLRCTHPSHPECTVESWGFRAARHAYPMCQVALCLDINQHKA